MNLLDYNLMQNVNIIVYKGRIDKGFFLREYGTMMTYGKFSIQLFTEYLFRIVYLDLFLFSIFNKFN